MARDPRRSPDLFDVPGNGIDEDCSGADTPLPKKPPPKDAGTEAPAEARRHFNVILITVDTLRADVGFLGYPKPVTPNLQLSNMSFWELLQQLCLQKALSLLLLSRKPLKSLHRLRSMRVRMNFLA